MNLSFKTLRKIVTSLAIIWGASLLSAYGEERNSSSSLSLKENLDTPPVSSKSNGAVSRHIESIKKKFEEKGLNAKTVRNNEVLLITVAAEDLFRPNETELKPDAFKTLNYFSQAINHPESYRLVVAVYSDDTGDDEYSLELTRKRAASIKDTFTEIADNRAVALNIDYYWFGNTNYAVPNNSIANRSKNRRVELYLVPEQHIIEASRAH